MGLSPDEAVTDQLTVQQCEGERGHMIISTIMRSPSPSESTKCFERSERQLASTGMDKQSQFWVNSSFISQQTLSRFVPFGHILKSPLRMRNRHIAHDQLPY